MPPPNFCARRKRLYQPQLDLTATFLENVLKSKNFTDADRSALGRALADKKLVDALEEILIPYVLYGVLRDFERLRMSNALFCDGPKGHPPLSKVLPPGSPSPKGPLPGYTPASISPVEAYVRYFDLYIDPADVGGGESGVDAFYGRYPLLKHAVETVTSHHQHNIELACKRVAANWKDIGDAFFPRRTVSRLTKIQTTGNDFHKGGKQVLILTFDVSKDPTSGEDGTEPGRVVYKPSAVEIDCRIVGKSSVFDAVQPTGPKDGGKGFTQKTSLTELINKFDPFRPPGRTRGGFTTRPLPTYRILPYNRGSVAESYGYIEYLTHNPALPMPPCAVGELVRRVPEEVKKLAPSAVSGGDWVTDKPADAQVFFHQLGGLMAMATAISLCDLHQQNVIVHDRRPHLIDLEEALKMPMTSIDETYLTGVLDEPADPEAPVLRIEKDRTSNIYADYFGETPWGVPAYKPATSNLYLYRGTKEPGGPARIQSLSGTPAVRGGKKQDPEKLRMALRDSLEYRRNRTALFTGVVDVVEALAANADEVKAWLKDLDGTLARYVTRATKDYAAAGRWLFLTCTEADVTTLGRGARAADDMWYDRVNSNDAFLRAGPDDTARGRLLNTPKYPFREGIDDARKHWVQRHSKPTGPRDWAPPYFALEHPDHVWRDYLNCDVPCFYHRLGGVQLLNSNGDTVDVDATVQDQAKMSCKTAVPATWKATWKPGSGYLPRKATDVVGDQLDRLQAAHGDDAEIDQIVKEMLAGTLARQLGAIFNELGSGRKVGPVASARSGSEVAAPR